MTKSEIRRGLEDMLVEGKFDNLNDKDKQTINDLFIVLGKEWKHDQR